MVELWLVLRWFEVLGSGVTNNVLDLHNNEEQPEMPQQIESDKMTKNMFNIRDHLWKGNVYGIKDHKRGYERPILQPYQERIWT